MIFQVKIEQGRVKTETPQKFAKFLETLEGKKAELTLEERKIPRTMTQNAYLHVLFGYISDHTGESLEEIKTIEKRRHLPPKEIKLYGKIHLILPSVTKLDKWETNDFIEKVLADCAFLGIIVPTREELGYGPK